MKTLLKNLSEDKISVDTIIPLEIESPLEIITDGPRDESKLRYEELLEDYHKYEKSAVMQSKTFDRLWN